MQQAVCSGKPVRTYSESGMCNDADTSRRLAQTNQDSQKQVKYKQTQTKNFIPTCERFYYELVRKLSLPYETKGM